MSWFTFRFLYLQVCLKLSHTGLTSPLGTKRLRLPAEQEGGKVSTTHRPPLPPRRYSYCSFLLKLESIQAPQCGRIKSLKNPNDPIGNRARDLPACSTVPQPTASPRNPPLGLTFKNSMLCLQSACTCFAWISEKQHYFPTQQ
jgi:hypothetical protein